MIGWAGITISIISLAISLFTFVFNLVKQKKIDTLNELSKIRVKYPSFKMLDNVQKLEYMQKMEFFALGVHEGMYDINIVKKMSRKRLLNQYDNDVSSYFNENNIDEYAEFRKLMEEIR